MKKLLIALFVIIAIIGIGLFVFVGKMDSLVKDVIEKEGSAALGSPVKVESVVTDLKNGSAVLNNFTISNPAGYKAANAIEIKSFSASVDYRSQIINSIEINNPIINAEQKGNKNNFQDLLQNMPAADEVEGEEAVTEGDDTVITIKLLALRKATVNLITSDLAVGGMKFELGDRSFVMDDFVMNDLNGTVTEISDLVIERLTSHVSTQVKGYVKKEAASMAKGRLMEEAKNRINQQLEEKLGGKLDVDLNDQAKEKVGEKLKGLKLKFGKN
ncbi:MAG: hypothetical protein JKX81_00510 [Arenicella sp.]|nr:hypothetical protein [Arenicella sp.]